MTGVLWLCLALMTEDAAPSIQFDSQIVPVLTKSGCNAGACHGAAAGRGGFHLSLLGADPAADFEAITQALEGRRINVAHPERSLILTKSTEQLSHGGGTALEVDSAGADKLLSWIRSGASRGTPRQLTRLEISPQRHLSQQLPDVVRLSVTASFDNGPPEDVTAWTVFTPADPAAIEIDSHMAAHVLRRGQHVVIARFLDRVVPIQLSSPLSDVAIDLSAEPRTNFIDQHVLQVLSDLRIPVSPPAADSAWLRRVTLDLTGRLPEPQDVEQFLADESGDKRSLRVEQLLASDAFADYWTLRFARLLRMHSLPNDREGVGAYAAWLREEIAAGTPLDHVARELLTATGDSHVVGPANFNRMVSDARDHADLVGQFFLGMRLGCANCHNHPLDKWTQDDYHGLAAVFARIDRGREVRLTARGAVTNLRTNEPAIPRIPGERYLPGDDDQRGHLADWLTSGENRYFAKATVNRLWRAMFGRGLVEPTDDLRETNPATHPELLNELADDFLAHHCSLRHTLRTIVLSATYGRSSSVVDGNAADDRFWSHAVSRPQLPEVVADLIADVTGVANDFNGQTPGSRAVNLIDPLIPAPVLDILGRCSRAADCPEDDDSSGGGLPTQLHLLNGDLINARLSDPNGRLRKLVDLKRSNVQIIDEFFVRALTRHPTSEELSRWQDRLSDERPDERLRKLEDFVWSLLSSRPFMENH